MRNYNIIIRECKYENFKFKKFSEREKHGI